MPYKIIAQYFEALLTGIFTMFLTITFTSGFSVLAAIMSLLRIIYLIKLDAKNNHNGSLKNWFYFLIKKNQ